MHPSPCVASCMCRDCVALLKAKLHMRLKTIEKLKRDAPKFLCNSTVESNP